MEVIELVIGELLAAALKKQWTKRGTAYVSFRGVGEAEATVQEKGEAEAGE